MPKRTDIKKILVLGSGPIKIGQACEFDYSGTQAIKALKEEGYEVSLVNSNPATIMTDKEFSDRVYIEPLLPEYVEQIIERDRPDAILPTMGGQTALNLALELHEQGVLKKYNVQLLGADPEVIHRAEDRKLFKEIMTEIGVGSARSEMVSSPDEAKRLIKKLGLPLVLRPSFTLGGEGGGIVHTEEDLIAKLKRGLFLSPTDSVLVEESMLGWKEYELEVVRDHKDNVIIVCSIENFDPMGVHTGDSITIAPAQTLTDREYQELRDQSIKIIRAIGVETGGSNIQFSVNPEDGRIIVIEMNPRVSRSSALASKATGFPIARVAAKLAVGYSLDELTNEITGTTPSSFEPSIDYVVTKIPRFDFKKFSPTEPFLSTQMKSVGEVMAIGRTFEESFGKALAGLEINQPWLAPLDDGKNPRLDWSLIETPQPKRVRALADAIRLGVSIQELHERTKIDPWFLDRIAHHLEAEAVIRKAWPPSAKDMAEIKSRGWSDLAIAKLLEKSEVEVRTDRIALNVHGRFHRVDTCAAEFEAQTPFLFSSYRGEDESNVSDRKKIMILGGGPNRIGQGIEFDYCCVHAALALREEGFECIMVNSNPETVSTDFDISDKLYFEPLTPEHVLNIARIEKPDGVVVQLGGQTPLKIARELEAGGLPIVGTSVDSIDRAEDREQSSKIVESLAHLGLKQPEATTARTAEEALARAKEIGFPVLCRPSFVLGGRGMRILHSEEMLKEYIEDAISESGEHPVLIDRFLYKAIEVDVDSITDGEVTLIGGLMEHIEEAGIHSGDSTSVLPPITLPRNVTDRIRTFQREIAKLLDVRGLMNVQYAVHQGDIYLLEINPRGSRTVPFIAKATGFPLAKIALKVMTGKTLKQQGLTDDFDSKLKTYAVKAPVFPFDKFPEVDTLLGPEMKSTGEVMGRDRNFPAAFSKAFAAAGMKLPHSGAVFMSIRNEDKAEAPPIARDLSELGFEVYATSGTASFLESHGITVKTIHKVKEGSPHCVEAIQDGKFSMIINTTSDVQAIKDSFSIRRAALEKKLPYATVLSSARAMIDGIREGSKLGFEVGPL